MKISVAQLSRMLRKGNVTGPALIDLRSPAAYRRSHPRGAVSIPASRIGRSLFLLPPRPRMLVLIGADPAQASACAAHLNEKGWTRVSWLDGAAADLDPALSASGREANRIWEPNPLLKRFEARLPRDGLACDLACGSGRDAAYLALGGRTVLGVDRLPDALRQARILARAAAVGPPGVARFRLVDLEEPRSAARLLKPRRFSVITCFRYLQREVLPLIEAALAPAGWLVYQTFLEEQARRGGRPHRPEFLLRPGELRDRFRGLTRIYYREGRDREGSWTAAFVGRRGRARVFPAGAEEAASVMIPAPSPSDPR